MIFNDRAWQKFNFKLNHYFLDMKPKASTLQQAEKNTDFYTVLTFDEAVFVMVCLPRTGTLDRSRLETAV